MEHSASLANLAYTHFPVARNSGHIQHVRDLGGDGRATDAFHAALGNGATPAEQISPARIEARSGVAGLVHRSGHDAEARISTKQALDEANSAKSGPSPSLQTYFECITVEIGAP